MSIDLSVFGGVPNKNFPFYFSVHFASNTAPQTNHTCLSSPYLTEHIAGSARSQRLSFSDDRLSSLTSLFNSTLFCTTSALLETKRIKRFAYVGLRRPTELLCPAPPSKKPAIYHTPKGRLTNDIRSNLWARDTPARQNANHYYTSKRHSTRHSVAAIRVRWRKAARWGSSVPIWWPGLLQIKCFVSDTIPLNGVDVCAHSLSIVSTRCRRGNLFRQRFARAADVVAKRLNKRVWF